jgi:hypothetical protein
MQRYNPCVQKISSAGFLYDPYLGDVIYPEWFWIRSIEAAGFDSIEIFRSGLPPVQGGSLLKSGVLTHFICQVKK